MFKAKFSILLVLSLLCISFLSEANNVSSIKTLSNVNKILQDKDGFIWLAGQQGLTRFDANSNVTFSLSNQEWPMPYSWIHNMSLIDDKLLLATETHGLWLFHTQTGTVKKIPVDIPKQNHFDAVMFKDEYYINVPDKLYRYNPSTTETIVIESNISIDHLVHNQEHLYIANEEGLFQLQDNRLVNILNEPITALKALTNAVIAITANNIYRFSDDGTISSIKHDETIYGLTKAFDSDDFFTVNKKNTISKYNGLSLAKIPHHYGQSKTLRIRDMFHDASGVLWLVSNQGVEQVNEDYITNHEVIFDIPINANEIKFFDNEIIIGSYGAGLQNFLKPVFKQSVNTGFTKKGLKIFDAIEVDKSLYIASLDGLWRYDKNQGKVTKLNIIADQLVLKLRHKNNLLYIATNYDGLYIYDLASEKMINHVDVNNGLLSPEIIDVLTLNNGTVWIANSRHISIYQQTTNVLTTINSPNKSKVVSFVLVDNKIFASTLGDGILVFNQQGDLLAQLYKDHSFTEMIVINGDVWVSGQPGLYRISAKNYQVTMIENTQQYSFVSSMLVKDDTLYAIHYSGILALDLSEQKQFNPNVIISKTTISGKAKLLNKSIEIDSGNDVITLDLASLDFRPGLAKKYQYRINNSQWQQISNNQLTLTGLASGHYNVEIMATNSLGHWSDVIAYTEIDVAYPWYWTIELKIFYIIIALFTVLLTSWLLFLRTKSIKNIHSLLKDDMKNCGRIMKTIQRNLQLTSTSLASNEIEHSKQLIEKSLVMLKESLDSQEPDSLSGKELSVAIPFLADYVQNKYEVKLHCTLDDKIDSLKYELRSDIYKVIFEALISGIFKSDVKNFKLTLQEVKKKLWLSINSDSDSFNQLNSRINFDLASYTIRQITNKHHASMNTFENDDGSSQLVISFPLMTLD
ncbi:putative signal transduction histidine kinase [Colwellia psychrerythraea]|uniref:Putative signal transduction histidine kinase n=1 Tax=Colwellia psychrerythraea TaxID=28229 RepID=A0A099KT15_COLPS|nr:putative signal transduction histidine kinase [Colwellia psychrerythraea]